MSIYGMLVISSASLIIYWPKTNMWEFHNPTMLPIVIDPKHPPSDSKAFFFLNQIILRMSPLSCTTL